jgi:hypothetical protein
MYDTFEVYLFGSKQGEPFAKVETHLIPEGRDGTRACAVLLFVSALKDMAEHVVIEFHQRLMGMGLMFFDTYFYTLQRFIMGDIGRFFSAVRLMALLGQLAIQLKQRTHLALST